MFKKLKTAIILLVLIVNNLSLGLASSGDIDVLIGDRYLESLISYIHNAKESICVKMYLFTYEELAGVLIDAYKRGLKINIILDRLNKNDHKNEKIYKILKQAGSIPVPSKDNARLSIEYDSLDTLTHSKLIVIDESTVILGSTNWTHNSLFLNKEASVAIKSKTLAGGYLKREIISDNNIYILNETNYFPALLKRISNARKSILVVMYRWSISKDSACNLLFNKLEEARKRGVNVSVILDQQYRSYLGYLGGKKVFPTEENFPIYCKLKEKGIDVSFDSISRITHAKLIIIDDYISILGSQNWQWNGMQEEDSVLIYSKEIASELKSFINSIERQNSIISERKQIKEGIPIPYSLLIYKSRTFQRGTCFCSPRWKDLSPSSSPQQSTGFSPARDPAICGVPTGRGEKVRDKDPRNPRLFLDSPGAKLLDKGSKRLFDLYLYLLKEQKPGQPIHLDYENLGEKIGYTREHIKDKTSKYYRYFYKQFIDRLLKKLEELSLLRYDRPNHLVYLLQPDYSLKPYNIEGKRYFILSEFENSDNIKLKGILKGKRIFPLKPMVNTCIGRGRQRSAGVPMPKHGSGKPWVSPIEHFILPIEFFNYKWIDRLSLKAQYLYLISLLESSIYPNRPWWSRSYKGISQMYRINTNTIWEALTELSRNNIIEVYRDAWAPDSPFTAREKNRYFINPLPDPEKLKNTWRRLYNLYPKNTVKSARQLAEELDEPNDPLVIEAFIGLILQYGLENVKKANSITARFRRSYGKRHIGYTMAILERQFGDKSPAPQ